VGEDDSYIEISGYNSPQVSDNHIKSSNYNYTVPVAQRQGFIIKGNGDAEFNNIRLRGHVEATSGNIANIAGQNLNIQGGTINIGPLLVSEAQIGGSEQETIPSATLIATLVNTHLPQNPSYGSIHKTVPIYYGGTYGSWTLYSMTFTKEIRETGGSNTTEYLVYIITFNTSGGTKTVETLSTTSGNIGYQVVINGGGAGNTLRITGLPRNDSGPQGTLFVYQGENILRVVI